MSNDLNEHQSCIDCYIRQIAARLALEYLRNGKVVPEGFEGTLHDYAWQNAKSMVSVEEVLFALFESDDPSDEEVALLRAYGIIADDQAKPEPEDHFLASGDFATVENDNQKALTYGVGDDGTIELRSNYSSDPEGG